MEPTAELTAALTAHLAVSCGFDGDDGTTAAVPCATAMRSYLTAVRAPVLVPVIEGEPATREASQRPTAVNGRLLAGRYRLLRLLGRGGFGSVWRARDEVLNRDVAVKELLVDGVRGGSAREHLLREAQAAARVSTPGAVAVYDVLEDGGRPYIVMELLSGQTLAQTVDERGPLAAPDVIRIGLQLLATLEAAHAAGVLHRDLKPANVMLTDEPRGAVLLDFGIAKLADSELATVGPVGTPEFMAPELGRGARATTASDLYSLGVTLRCALEGGLLRQDHPAAVRPGSGGQDHYRLGTAGPLLPVLEALLQENPRARPSAVELRQLLEAALQGLGGSAKRTSQALLLPRPLSRKDARKSQASRGSAPYWPTAGEGQRTRRPAARRRLAVLAVLAALVAVGTWTARGLVTAPPSSSGTAGDRSGVAAAPSASDPVRRELGATADAQRRALDEAPRPSDTLRAQPSTPTPATSSPAQVPSASPSSAAPPVQAGTNVRVADESPTMTPQAAAHVAASQYRAELVVHADADQMRAGYHLTVSGVQVRRGPDGGSLVEGTVHNPQQSPVQAVLSLSGHLGAAGEVSLTYTDAGCVPAASSRPITWRLPADMLDPSEGLRSYTDIRVHDASSVVGCGPVPAR